MRCAYLWGAKRRTLSTIVVFACFSWLGIYLTPGPALARTSGAQRLELLAGSENARPVMLSTDTTCWLYPHMRVWVKPRPEAAGQVIFASPSQADCQVLPAPLPELGELASFYQGKVGSYLIIDQGTGPSRRHLRIWDWRRQKWSYSATYEAPLLLKGGRLSVWETQSEPATAANCSEYAKIIAQGFSPSLQQLKIINLRATPLSQPVLRQKRCQATQ